MILTVLSANFRLRLKSVLPTTAEVKSLGQILTTREHADKLTFNKKGGKNKHDKLQEKKIRNRKQTSVRLIEHS